MLAKGIMRNAHPLKAADPETFDVDMACSISSSVLFPNGVMSVAEVKRQLEKDMESRTRRAGN